MIADAAVNTSARTLTRNVESLPSLPSVVLRVQSLIVANEARAEIARVIQTDPSLTARLLRAANSSFFGVRARIRTVEQALVLLGGHMVRNLLVMTAVHGTLRRFRLSPHFPLSKYWEHSLVTATLSKILTRRFGGVLPDDAFVAGLLHDLGRVTLASLFLDERAAIVVPGMGTGLEAERLTFGCDHVEIGVALAREWQLPEFVVEAIARHHEARDPKSVAGIVRAADSIAHWLIRRKAAIERDEEVEPLPSLLAESLGLDEETIEALAGEAETALQEAAALAST